MTSAFTIGDAYTRDVISATCGGSRRACLPTKDGVVVAACLLTSLNPDAPRVVLCGVGPRNGPMGVALAEQRGAIPFFVKDGVNRWLYRGCFVVDEVLRWSGCSTTTTLLRRAARPTACRSSC